MQESKSINGSNLTNYWNDNITESNTKREEN